MERDLLQVSDAISKNPGDSEHLVERRTKLDAQLADYNSDKHEFSMLRAGTKHHVDGESLQHTSLPC